MKILDYRSLYESSISLLLYNVIKDIAAMVAGVGLVKFRKKNKFDWNGKIICGVILQENGMFILTEDSMFEISDDNNDFADFASYPLNVVTLYE
jgi:hypothetical protein